MTHMELLNAKSSVRVLLRVVEGKQSRGVFQSLVSCSPNLHVITVEGVHFPSILQQLPVVFGREHSPLKQW